MVALTDLYRKARKPFVHPRGVFIAPANHALRTARTWRDWTAVDGFTTYESDREAAADFEPYAGYGRVRLVVKSDWDWQSALDCDFSERELERLRDRLRNEGCTGIVGEYWDRSEWHDVDSVWGFIGDDWESSGYAEDVMRAALDALADDDATAARNLESERPDMYGA